MFCDDIFWKVFTQFIRHPSGHIYALETQFCCFVLSNQREGKTLSLSANDYRSKQGTTFMSKEFCCSLFNLGSVSVEQQM